MDDTGSGWASINQGPEGPPIWDVVTAHIRKQGVVAPRDAAHVKLKL